MKKTKKYTNYLRTHRKRSGFSQAEMAFLLGTDCGTKISRYERFYRNPCLSTALAYAMIFNEPAEMLFAGLTEQTRDAIIERAEHLMQTLSKKPQNPVTQHKLKMLENIIRNHSEYAI